MRESNERLGGRQAVSGGFCLLGDFSSNLGEGASIGILGEHSRAGGADVGTSMGVDRFEGIRIDEGQRKSLRRRRVNGVWARFEGSRIEDGDLG